MYNPANDAPVPEPRPVGVKADQPCNRGDCDGFMEAIYDEARCACHDNPPCFIHSNPLIRCSECNALADD